MSTLVDCHFPYVQDLGCVCIGHVCEENDTESEPLHLAGACGVHHINCDVTGWLCSSVLGWYDLLLTRYLISPFTMALHVVKVYVVGVCRRHVCLRSH